MAGTGSSSVVSPPSSANRPQSLAASKKKKTKSTFRVVTEIIIALIIVELYFYQKLSLQEFEEMDRIEQDRMEKLVAPKAHRRKQMAEQERKQRQEAVVNENELIINDSKKDSKDPKVKEERWKTARKLQHMGVGGELELNELPPWSQIIENFNSYSNDDEPVILGLEHCASFREKTDPKRIGAAPAGMFSTGTNLVAKLMMANCEGPNGRISTRDKFALVQVPYGKHNPADARFHHQVKAPVVPDREAILPIVAIRHPYTWMSAMCKHSYQTRWKHIPTKCHESLYLENPIIKVPYGFKQYNETHNVTNSYESLAHMWKNWYTPYFLEEKYNQTPRLMVRHEDLVYRPEKVISKVCECVGGKNRNPNPDWGQPGGFQYEEESANRGKGHGKHGRSGLLTAIIKYGQPMKSWYDQYSGSDRRIMKNTFQGETDPILKKIFETFQYRLIDDVSETPDAVKKQNRFRAMEELKKKEAAYKEKEAAKKAQVDDKAKETQSRKASAEQRRKNAKENKRI